MTAAANLLQRPASATREDPAMHMFKLGQAVRLKGGFGRFASLTDIYRITGTLPPRGGSPQYRVQGEGERHERVATQDSLEPVQA